MQIIASDKDTYYETMVFVCHGEDENGDPDIDLSDIYCKRYANSLVAEKAHRRICDKIARGEDWQNN